MAVDREIAKLAVTRMFFSIKVMLKSQSPHLIRITPRTRCDKTAMKIPRGEDYRDKAARNRAG